MKAATILVVTASWAVWLCPAEGQSPASQPDRQPRRVDLDDAWLREILADELARCKSAEDFEALGLRTREVALSVLTCGRPDELKCLAALVNLMRACQYVPIARRMQGNDQLDRWLIAHKDISRRLFRGIGQARYPEEALRRIDQLAQAEPQKVLEYPDLAVAFALAQPLSENRTDATLVQSFRYYTRAGAEFRFDLRKMPYELSVYLADTRLPIDQRQWAVRQFAGRAEPEKTYFDVPYDNQAFYAGSNQPRRIAGRPYTLENIRQFSGVCADRAYFASQVSKALGVPAASVVGSGASGISHAWVACLKMAPNGRRAYWDSTVGRSEAHKYFVGEVTDPVSGRPITDVELMVSAAAAQLDLARREEADVAIVMARLVVASLGQDGPGIEPLRKLVELYNQRFKDAGPIELPEAFRPDRRLDAALAEELISLSLARNLVHRPAWDLLVELVAGRQLPPGHMDRYFDLLLARTVEQFADYSFQLLLRFLPALPEPAQQVKVCDRAMAVFARRPDLQGRLLLLAGEALLKDKKRDDALRCFMRATVLCQDAADVVLAAAEKAERLFRQAGRRDLAIGLYRDLFTRTPPAHEVKIDIRRSTLYYQVGLRLARVLEEDGQPREAEAILKQINANP